MGQVRDTKAESDASTIDNTRMNANGKEEGTLKIGSKHDCLDTLDS